MYRNKHGVAKRALYRLFRRYPSLGWLKGVFMPFRARKFVRRLDALRREVHDVRERTGKTPLFNHVEIETFNRCNGECGFCPVNRHVDPRPAAKMSEELFRSIIRQLGELDYDHEITLYSNNESLMDSRIEDFAALARRELPRTRILLSTNGTLLTPERYRALVDNVDQLTINNYCDDFRLTPGNAAIMEVAKSRPDWWEKTSIVIRYRGEIMNNRAGRAPNKKPRLSKPLKYGCPLPAGQMIIRPDGKLSLCCSDALGTTTVGDVARQSLVDAWNEPDYADLRVRLLDGRESVPMCRICDALM